MEHIPQVLGHSFATLTLRGPQLRVLPQLFFRSLQLPLHSLSAALSLSMHADEAKALPGRLTQLMEQHRPLRMAQWPLGQLVGGHIIRQSCGGELGHICWAAATERRVTVGKRFLRIIMIGGA